MTKTQFSTIETSIEIKTTTTTTVIKNKLKYFPMSEGNTCIAEPSLEVLTLIWFSKGLVSSVPSDTFLKCYCFTIR